MDLEHLENDTVAALVESLKGIASPKRSSARLWTKLLIGECGL